MTRQPAAWELLLDHLHCVPQHNSEASFLAGPNCPADRRLSTP